MISAERISEQYRDLTPQQRNIELKNLFKLIPDLADVAATRERIKINILINSALNTTPEDDLEKEYRVIAEDVARRNNSEMEQIIIHKLSILLSYATITKAGSERIIDRWKTASYFGQGDFVVMYEDPLAEYGRRYGWEPQGRGGMFNPSEAFEIEKKLYHQAIDTRRLFNDSMRKVREENPEALEAFDKFFQGWQDEEKKYPETSKEEQGTKIIIGGVAKSINGGDNLLERWREEIIALHGIEP